jgi:Zn-dependent protease/CBS domain-containing protein
VGRGAFSIGSIAGIRIALHPSWLVIAFVVTYLFAVGDLPDSFPGWDAALYWIVGAAVAALFFASVLAHELSHALVARRFGVQVRDITLFIFGGAASLEGDTRRPRDEALIAAAGPLSSLAIGGALLGLSAVVGQEQVAALIGRLGYLNVWLGIFNLIPGFPMDGGRILRALLWRIRGDEFAATRNAAAVGRAFGYLLVGVGVLIAFQPNGLFSGIWLALIGWFLSSAAESSVVQLGVQRSLRGVKVRDVMEAEPPSVSPNETIGDLVNERLMRGEHRSFLVRHDDGGLAGIVTLSDVRGVPHEDWPTARVTDIMTRYADVASVGPDDPVEGALELLQEKEVNQLPVVTDGGRTVVGLLTRAGIVRMIDTRLKLGV